MSEAVPFPLTAEKPARRRLRRRPGSGDAVSFSDLTRLHHARTSALRDDGTAPPAVEERYQRALRAFETAHGPILSGYWCTTVESAAVITRKRAAGPLARLRPGVIRLHRVSDYVTRDRPDVADLLHECDSLAVRASEVLRGTTQRICMELVMSSAARLLALVDTTHSNITAAERDRVLTAQRKEIESTRDYYRKTARREAQIVYTGGMLLGVVALAAVAAVLALVVRLADAGIEVRTFWGAFIAGAVGAVVSVASRITQGSFAVDYESGRGTLRRLGSFRPLLGSVFGLATFFALESGLLQLVPSGADRTQAFYYTIVLAFVAGFSERWARGVLMGAADEVKPAAPPGKPAPKAGSEPDSEAGG